MKLYRKHHNDTQPVVKKWSLSTCTVISYKRHCIILVRNIATNGALTRYENCGLRMRRECRDRFPRHWPKRNPQVSDPGMYHGTCVMHMSSCMSGSLTRCGWENVPGIAGACATRNFVHLVRGPWNSIRFETCRVKTDRHTQGDSPLNIDDESVLVFSNFPLMV